MKWKSILIIITVMSGAMVLMRVSSNRYLTAENPPLRAIKATLRVVPMEYEGPCPAEIKFKAKISVTGGKGTVLCQIVRSDSLPAPAISMVFPKSGTRDTSFILRQNQSFLGWFQLKVASPNVIHSNKVDLSVLCQ